MITLDVAHRQRKRLRAILLIVRRRLQLPAVRYVLVFFSFVKDVTTCPAALEFGPFYIEGLLNHVSCTVSDLYMNNAKSFIGCIVFSLRNRVLLLNTR